jgi:hypothetical protein
MTLWKNGGVRYFFRFKIALAANIDARLGDESAKVTNDSGRKSSPEQLLHIF